MTRRHRVLRGAFMCGVGSAAFALAGCQQSGAMCVLSERTDLYKRPEPALSMAPLFAPRRYEAQFLSSCLAFDGKLNDAAWSAAQWSEPFADIEGPARATPQQQTRVKMLWDETNLYIGADLTESDLWATLTEHDEIVYRDNDFEVFVDPDGDTREYYEIEVNAIGTIFDLYLPVPYRAGAKADHSWTAHGMRVAIHLDGTLNDPSDIDRGWQIEMAIPWSVFSPMKRADGERTFQRVRQPPTARDAWRINFSRVQWTLEKSANSYAKVARKPEDNWTWTPQWIVDMHVPQWWGVVMFAAPTEQLKEKSK